MSLPVTDAFTRSDAGTLGGNWTINAGTVSYSVASNQAKPPTSSGVYQYWNADVFGNDQYSQCVLSAYVTPATLGDGYVGLQVRASGTNTSESGYGIFLIGSNAGILYKYVAGSYTTLLSSLFTPSAGDLIKLSAVATTITYYVNGVQKNQVTDAALSSGSAGITGLNSVTDGNIIIDSWEGGNVSSSSLTFVNLERGIRGLTRGLAGER